MFVNKEDGQSFDGFSLKKLNPKNWKLGTPKAIITVPKIDNPIVFWPFILMPKDKGENVDKAALVIHENTHLEQQKKMGPFLWQLRHSLDHDFEWKQEKEAYTNQIRNLQSRGVSVDYDSFINHILTSREYKGMAPSTDVKNFIYGLRDSNPYATVGKTEKLDNVPIS